MKLSSTGIGILLVVLAATAACDKKKDAGAGGAGNAASTGPGCGSDWADPLKLFCVKVPAGYTAGSPSAPNVLYAEGVEFSGPNGGFEINVGFTSSTFTSYDEEVADEDKILNKPDTTIQSTGGTPGESKWWITQDKGFSYKVVRAIAKSNGNKAIICSPTSTGDLAPEIVEACKSVRAYPGGAPPLAYTAPAKTAAPTPPPPATTTAAAPPAAKAPAVPPKKGH
jgi:hypothetical protein